MANGLLLLSMSLCVASALPRPLIFTAADAYKGALLFGVGDGVAQSLERRRTRGRAAGVLRGGASHGALLDSRRLAKATALGAINGGLLLPFVYQLAEGLLPGRSLRTVARHNTSRRLQRAAWPPGSGAQAWSCALSCS